MSVDRKELTDAIEKIAPPELMESWDNTGMQILLENDRIERILVCLDVCEETVNEAIDKKCDFIVSHHPLFFMPLKSINCGDAKGRLALKLIKSGISVYSAHTSFDTVEGGNNDFLAEILELENVFAPEEEPIMRVGCLAKPVSMARFCEKIDKDIMGGKGLSYSGDINRKIQKVGICTGAGASFVELAAQYGCDVMITGDVKYHEFQHSDELGISLIDAGHFETEITFAYNMREKLADLLGNRAEVISAESQKNSLKRFFSME